jgi:hypothetical protein
MERIADPVVGSDKRDDNTGVIYMSNSGMSLASLSSIHGDES